MSTILITIGSFKIYTVSFFLSAAFLCATFVIWREGRRRSFEEEKLLDLVVLSTVAGIFMGRIAYILLNLHLFHNFSDYLFFWHISGISFFGAAFGAVIAAFWYIRRNHWPVSTVFDVIGLGIVPGLAIYKLGTYVSGGGFGIQSSSFLAVRFLGLPNKYLPVSLFETVLFSILFIVLLVLYRKTKLRKGYYFSAVLITIGIILSSMYMLENHALMNEPALTLASRLAIIIVGLACFYLFSERNLRQDFRTIISKIRFSRKEKDIHDNEQ